MIKNPRGAVARKWTLFAITKLYRISFYITPLTVFRCFTIAPTSAF